MDPTVLDELRRCIRCGTCMGVCPVYEVMRREAGSARGKLALVAAREEGVLGDEGLYRHLLTACLLCGRCTNSCPNQVDVPRVVRAARAGLAERGRLGRLERLVLGRLLPGRRGLARLLGLARLTRWVWAARVPGESGLHLRFARLPGGARRRLPALARPFFLERPQAAQAAGQGPRVALFVGCVNNYLRPEAAQAALEVLAAAGARVEAPAGQGCCGLPAFSSGAVEGARALAARNLEALWPAGEPGPDLVTSPCASCASMLAHHLPGLLAGDPARAERARALAARVKPFSVVVTGLGGVRGEGPGRGASADLPALTYHDPCHLSRGFGEKDAPRFLLTWLPGLRFVEPSHPCRCCGQGGTFALHHPELSEALGQDKARRLIETGARYVVTECSGCWLQLQDLLARAGSEMEVLTTAEALRRWS
ncbi:MAG TPA: (Fe-S)-binding protein [Myxococcota bacterium]|nr:(Fe-S)-binding protein [Myxococcota bacterium]HRY96740.1 (Fe-S)-binding protein [Myxococcota bacterium]HSA23425.1 (Fe-S)-binding protein [Myxococcota bacterium]